MFQEIRNRVDRFSGVSAFAGPAHLNLAGNGTATMVSGELVSGDYFQTLGVPAALGRTLEAADEEPGAEAVLSYAYWQGAFGLISRFLGSLLYQVRPTDPVTLCAVCILFLLVGLLACWIPARRAALVDPMSALRCE
jgi:MacB-like periplasmic core domain